MKRTAYTLLAVLILATMTIIFATPVFADDPPLPPDTQVSVVVVTPGDVDLNVGVQAGGNVAVTVDGYDLSKVAADATKGANGVPEPGRGVWDGQDWYRAWNKEIAPYKALLQQHNQTLSILTEAESKLIQGQGLTEEELGTLSSALQTLNSNTDTSIANISNTLTTLKAQDDKTWNQLMNGAEYHLGLLQTVVDDQGQTITSLQNQLDTQKAELDTANSNHTYLLNYTDYLRRQYMYYFWIIGGCMIVLLGLTIWSLARKR